jgi:hypothetical protein
MTTLYIMLSKTIIYKPFLSAFSPFYLTVYLTIMTDKIVSICEHFARNLCTLL